VDYAVIFEDDVELIEGFRKKLQEVMVMDFDMIYLNGTDGMIRKPKPFNQYLNKVEEMYGTFGYAIHRRFIPEAIKWLSRESYPCDKIYSMFIGLFQVFKVKSPLVFHRYGMSDIQGLVPKNYKHLERAK
jgi:GR25 family glycosyltransferase involved in LPS biosynthesis